MSRKTKKKVEEFKTKLIEKGIDVSEFEEYFKEIESNLKDKKYGLVWENHTEEIETELLTKIPILKEEKELRIHNTEEGLTNNFLIEGDNLESLTALKNMGKKVDVMYVDVPYNTFNGELVYGDSVVDKEDSYRHSKWISFMEVRLKLARGLLTDDGVIFIHIDDNELSNLKILMDEVFGEHNFVSNIPRRTKRQRGMQEKYLNNSHDYILVYVKDKTKIEDFNKVIDRSLQGKKIKEDSIGSYIQGDTKALVASVTQGYSKGGDYDFELDGVVYKPEDSQGNRNRWLWTESRMSKAKELGILVGNGKSIRAQLYLEKQFDVRTNTMVEKETKMKFSSMDVSDGMGYTNSDGSIELVNMGMRGKFSNPKPTKLISLLTKLHPNKNATVLDFFAGSGTTGQAVLELNKEDGGNRNFILCTNNENNICRDVTYQRLNKVINGYTTPKGKEVEGIPSNLTYLKTELLEKEDDLVDFEVSEEIYENMVNNLKVLHNISNTINLKEGRLKKLVGVDKNFYLYDNFYIDSNDFEEVKLDSNKTNVVYVKEENLTDVVLNKFDEVVSLEDLVRY